MNKWFFEKKNKIDTLLDRLFKEKQRGLNKYKSEIKRSYNQQDKMQRL